MSTYEFLLPDVGEGLSEGEIVEWHVAIGDTVKRDQLLVEVQTDKAIVEIPSPVTGTIIALGGAPNDVLAVGAMLATLEIAAATPTGTVQTRGTDSVAGGAAPAPTLALSATGASSATGAPRRPRASPATRKLARDRGVDLATVQASGARGQITHEDVRRAAESAQSSSAAVPPPSEASSVTLQPASPEPVLAESGRSESALAPAVLSAAVSAVGRTEPLRGLRRRIALTMDKAWRTVPHIFSMDTLDAVALVEVREVLNHDLAGQDIKLSFLPFFVKACAAALRAEPRFNASIDLANESVTYHADVNIGIATQTADGLIVPVVHHADTRSLVDIAIEIARLADAARDRRVKLEQLTGATFSISNYGSYGGHTGTPIIRPPECAIAGFGRIEDAVVARGGVAVVRKTLPFCVSADHRLNDGEDLGRFIDTMRRYLAAPIRLLGQR
ncbi:MAG: hypothetical protein GKR94_31765 [Gammaproteobacteria bacterium]|nr:hypothetical protein [Gammaproteobacteria bacterium]